MKICGLYNFYPNIECICLIHFTHLNRLTPLPHLVHPFFSADQPPRSQSIVTIFWALIVRLVSGKHPRLFSYQNSLPRMSVPSLHSTIDGFLRSVKPLLSEEQYAKMEKDAKVGVAIAEDASPSPWLLCVHILYIVVIVIYACC